MCERMFWNERGGEAGGGEGGFGGSCRDVLRGECAELVIGRRIFDEIVQLKERLQMSVDLDLPTQLTRSVLY